MEFVKTFKGAKQFLWTQVLYINLKLFIFATKWPLQIFDLRTFVTQLFVLKNFGQNDQKGKKKVTALKNV